MFTGIVESLGRVTGAAEARLEIDAPLDDLAPGDSVAVNGVCLTVASAAAGRFAFDLSEETISRTTLGRLAAGDAVNLERPLVAGGRLGGHVVQGHVDGVAIVREVRRLPGSVEIAVETPPGLRRYLVEKGSVAVDGVSLTVAALESDRFWVALVPVTVEDTTLGARRPGEAVNLEVDILAKYVERLLGREGEG